MGILDYIPVIGTVKHAFFDDPPGRTVADYAACATTARDCAAKGEELAVDDCARCITGKAAEFLGSLLGQNLLPDIIRSGIGAAVAIFSERLLGALGVRLVAGGATAATGVGLVLIGDAAIDAAITVSRAGEIRDAAERAPIDLCRCPPRQ
jgi:hypothetical protein